MMTLDAEAFAPLYTTNVPIHSISLEVMRLATTRDIYCCSNVE